MGDRQQRRHLRPTRRVRGRRGDVRHQWQQRHARRIAFRPRRPHQDRRGHDDAVRRQQLSGRDDDQRRHLAVTADANLGAAAGGLAFGGGTLQFLSGFTTNRTVTLNAGGGTFDTNGNNATLAGAIGGAGGLTKVGAGTMTLSGASTYLGGTTVNAGTLQAGATNVFAPVSAFTIANGATLNLASFNQSIGSLAGAGAVTLGAATLTTGNDNTSTTFSGAISGTGGLTKIGTGTLLLTGTSNYTGATTVNAGTLSVNGSIASSALTVNAGGTSAATATIGNTTINGGTLSPGNSIGTLTVQGNLVLTSAAAYLVEVSPTAADRTNVTGTASLAGTVQAVFGPGATSRAPTPSSRLRAEAPAPSAASPPPASRPASPRA